MSRQVRGIAIVVALAAIAYVVISHRNHHDGVDTGGVPVDVLVASQRIQRGTPGNVIRTTGLYKIRNIPQGNIEPGVILDPAAFAGRVALTDIAAGQQLTTADFGRCACLFTPGPSRRAVIVSPREIRGHVTAGSRVDVWDGGRHRSIATWTSSRSARPTAPSPCGPRHARPEGSSTSFGRRRPG